MHRIKRKTADLAFDLIDEHLVEALVGIYGVGPLVSVPPLIIEEDAVTLLQDKSTTSRKIVLETKTGKFFLKEVPWYCSEIQQIRFTHRVMEHLADRDIAVPRLMRTVDGETFAEIAGRKFTLSHFLSGAPYKGTSEQFIAAAHELARMHLAASEFTPDPCARQPNLYEIVRSHVLLAREVADSKNTVADLLDWLDSQCERYFAPLKRFPSLPVHGDFIPWNVAFDSGGVTAIYDFDNCCLDSRLHDLGEAIVGFFGLNYAGRTSRLDPSAWIEPKAQEVLPFVAAYESLMPLSRREKDALPLFILGSWWECLLLSFIRKESSLETLNDTRKMPSAVKRLWRGLGFNDTILEDL